MREISDGSAEADLNQKAGQYNQQMDEYMKQAFPKCWDCPVLRASVEEEMRAERTAEYTAEYMQDLNASRLNDQDFGIVWATHAALGSFLDENTKIELRARKVVALLTSGEDECPGTKRGLPKPYSLIDRLIDYAINTRSCRNPALRDVVTLE